MTEALTAAGGAVYGKRMYDIQQADWENYFEEYIAPFLRERQKVYEPTGAAIRERLMTPVTSYGFEPQWQQARERVGKESSLVGQRLAQEYARRRIGAPVYGKLTEARTDTELQQQRELARDIAIRASTERAQRISEALSYSGMQPPQIPIGTTPSGGEMNWGKVISGAGQDIGYWLGFALGMKGGGMQESPYRQPTTWQRTGGFGTTGQLSPELYEALYGGKTYLSGGGASSPGAKKFYSSLW